MVAAIPQEAAIGYLEAWIAAESFDVARRLGSRLTVMAYPGNAWFPIEMYEGMRDHLTGGVLRVRRGRADDAARPGGGGAPEGDRAR